MTDSVYFFAGTGAIVLALLILLGYIFLSRRKKSVGPAVPSAETVISRIHEGFSAKLNDFILGTKQFDASFVDSLEELLYTGDLGPRTVEKLLTAVRSKLSRGELSDSQSVRQALYGEIFNILQASSHAGKILSQPCHVILVVGVNGAGKTTSIGKLAHYYATQGKRVMVVAGDTFRAAASEQLSVWGDRAQVEVYSSTQTKDPAAVAFEGVQKALAGAKDVVIIDTAGRLHTKENLMEELKKVKRVIDKALPGAPHQVLLVIDANSGQNALVQARQFNEALHVTGLIVTKLDGTARGGIIVAIASEMGLGVEFIGVGEKINDLQPFAPQEYARGFLNLA